MIGIRYHAMRWSVAWQLLKLTDLMTADCTRLITVPRVRSLPQFRHCLTETNFEVR